MPSGNCFTPAMLEVQQKSLCLVYSEQLGSPRPVGFLALCRVIQRLNKRTKIIAILEKLWLVKRKRRVWSSLCKEMC